MNDHQHTHTHFYKMKIPGKKLIDVEKRKKKLIEATETETVEV